MKCFVLVLALLALGPGPVLAQAAGRSVGEREARLAARIDEGVRQKSLDKAQAARLRDRLRRIRSLETYYRRSHGFSPWERRDIERRLTALSTRVGADERRARPH